MAEIFLTREEAKGDLPALCMCCGAPAKTRVTRSFMLRDPEVSGGPFLEMRAIQAIAAHATVPRLSLPTYFCEQHRHYWHLRDGLKWGGLAGLLTLVFGGVAMIATLIFTIDFKSRWPEGCFLFTFVLYAIGWGTSMNRLVRNTMRARRHGDGRILLQNVGEEYVAALPAQRQP